MFFCGLNLVEIELKKVTHRCRVRNCFFLGERDAQGMVVQKETSPRGSKKLSSL